MITTVTTVVTTVTTVTSIAAMGLAAVVLLILLLIAKELTGAGQSLFSRLSSRFLNVGVIPLIIVFAIIVAVRISEALA